MTSPGHSRPPGSSRDVSVLVWMIRAKLCDRFECLCFTSFFEGDRMRLSCTASHTRSVIVSERCTEMIVSDKSSRPLRPGAPPVCRPVSQVVVPDLLTDSAWKRLSVSLTRGNREARWGKAL